MRVIETFLTEDGVALQNKSLDAWCVEKINTGLL